MSTVHLATAVGRPADADALTGRYLDAMRRDPALRTLNDQLPLTGAITVAAARQTFSRPLFVDTDVATAFARDIDAIFDLIASIPVRIFDGDRCAFAEVLGVDAERARIMASTLDTPPPRYGRADMYHDGSAFRLLEFNIASEIGGIDRAGELPAAFLATPEFDSVTAGLNITDTDTAEAVAATLRGLARGTSAATVALVDAPGSMAGNTHHWLAMQEVLGRRGVTVVLAETGDLQVDATGVYVGDTRADVVLRYVSVDELVGDSEAQAALERIVDADRRRLVSLWTPPSTTLYGNKLCLALLSTPSVRRLAPGDAALVDRVLPWTRSLQRLPEQSSAEYAGIVDHCLRSRSSVVLKPAADYGGHGVIAGWECTQEQWESHVRSAVETPSGYIAQRRVQPRPEPVIGEHGSQQIWHASWGAFITPAGPAGLYARVLPADQGAVIGLSANKQTRTAAVLTYQARPTTGSVPPGDHPLAGD